MNLIDVLSHGGTLFGAAKKIESVTQKCINEKRMPTADEDKVLLSAMLDILKTGVIQLPAGSEEAVEKFVEEVARAL